MNNPEPENEMTSTSTLATTPPVPVVDITVMVPVFNEEGNLDILYERLTRTLKSYGKSYEIVFIDDGSTDRSYEMLKGLHAKDPAVRVVRFLRNFGQQSAIAAAFSYARGSAIIQMDADLQISPEEIPPLVDKLNEGYDVVYGLRVERHDSLIRRVGSWGMSALLYRFMKMDIPDGATGFLALSGDFARHISLFNEKSKYFNGLYAWLSYGRWAAIPVSHSPRHSGKSKYTIRQLVTLTLNFVCNFTLVPLRISLHMGWFCMLLSVIGAIVLGIGAFGIEIQSIWILANVIVFFSGVQLFTIGILGEYIGRIFTEVKEQPDFVVWEVLDHDTKSST